MRIHKIRAAVQVAVDWSYGFGRPKAALDAIDKACSHKELSTVSPIASAIRLLVFYAELGSPELDFEGKAQRLHDLKFGVQRLAGIILGQVAPSPQPDDAPKARDVKMLAAGDTRD
jgi:hypothetical protein